VKDLVLT